MSGSGIGTPVTPGAGYTFLKLVQRLFSETARQGVAPTTTVSQSGMNQRLINWINTAYEDIQNLHETWIFRRKEFEFSTIAAQANYTYNEVGLTDLASWFFNPDHNHVSGIRAFLTENDEQDLIFFPWEDFRANYLYSANRSVTTRPTVFTIKTDQSIQLWAIPDKVYTINGEYIAIADTLDGDTDTPVFNQYQMIIVWRALMFYGAFEGAPEVYAHAENEYKALLRKLEFNQLPRMGYGPPLA